MKHKGYAQSFCFYLDFRSTRRPRYTRRTKTLFSEKQQVEGLVLNVILYVFRPFMPAIKAVEKFSMLYVVSSHFINSRTTTQDSSTKSF